MKKLFVFLSFLLTFAIAHSTPHLILNFDINKTLIASDKTENKSLEDVINELLSRKYSARWDEAVEEPITFDAYVRTVMLPGEEHDVKLKMARLVHLTHFLDYLKHHEHPLHSAVLEEFNTIIGTLQNAHIFPSFYKLIAELDRRDLTYTLFLRSFGKEVFEVKDEINSQLNDIFQVEGKFRKGKLYVRGEEPLTSPQSIYRFFCSKEHAAIHDDWPYWMEGKMYAKYGKPLYLNLDDPHTLSIFFDDNIKTDSFDKNIIAPLDSNTGEPLSIPYLLKSKQMVFVDTLEAILNEDYFIEKIDEALQAHEDVWKQRKRLAVHH